MGGPSHLSEVEVFLKNMFKDPHILPVKSALMRKFLGSMIVKKRLEKAKANYRAIGGKSPMIEHTFALCQKLQAMDKERFYSYAMRYTPPFTHMALEEMRQKGIQKLHLFSMYPQYSSTTTLSSFSEVHRALKEMDYRPVIEVVERYYDDARYHALMADEIVRSLGDRHPEDFVLVFSAHSLPQSIIDRGDPYERECEATFGAMKQALAARGMVFKDIVLSYQSRLGRMQWIGPSTKSVIERFGGQKLIVYPLGFTIDNSETIFEIDIEYRELARSVGIEEFVLCPCFNDHDDFAQLILEYVR